MMKEETMSTTHLNRAMAVPRRRATDVEGFLAFLAETHPDQYEALMAPESSGALADVALSLADLLSAPASQVNR